MAVALLAWGLPMIVVGWGAASGMRPQDLSAWIAPHREAWYALPLVMAGYVALCVFPVVLLIAATGLAFGPVLGPLYAMAGCLASASAAFGVGRWLGRGRLAGWNDERVARVTRTLARNGTLAVFLIRKVPAPFTLVNLAIGASSIRYADFVIGTTLGMGAFVLALAGFGGQLVEAWRHPSASTIGRAAAVLGASLGLALTLNFLLQRRRRDHDGRA